MLLTNLTVAVHLSVRPPPPPSLYLGIQDPACAFVSDIPVAPRSPSSSDNREWAGLGSVFQLSDLKPVIFSQELLKSFGILEGKSCTVQDSEAGMLGSGGLPGTRKIPGVQLVPCARNPIPTKQGKQGHTGIFWWEAELYWECDPGN